METKPTTIILPVLVLFCWLPCARPASDYDVRKASAKQKCEAIDPSAYQTGLFFNPDGYRSYYLQSECFQNAAIQFRDSSLCEGVRRCWSLFSSSWGISSAQCRKFVTEAVQADRVELQKEKQLYTAHSIRLLRFQIKRNGNGRDFDFIPEFSADNGHGYRIVFEIIGVSQQPVLLHSDGYYVDANSRLNIFVRQADIRSRFPQFQLDHAYTVRMTVTFSVGMGGDSGYWSDGFIESVFPLRERSQSLTLLSRF